jgi:hypothetical protein
MARVLHEGSRGVQMSLEDDYEKELWQNCLEGDQRGYLAPWWKSMIKAHRGVRASVLLISRSGGEPQSGFKRLEQMGLVRTSVEYTMLKPKWRPLFTRNLDVLEVARFILRQAGVTPPDEDPEHVARQQHGTTLS